MQAYGSIFRVFREAKGLSIREVSEDIVSYQFLSNFEKGKSDVSLTNFVRLLEKINLTYEEFFKSYDDTLSELMSMLEKDLQEAIGKNNQIVHQQILKKYQKLYQESSWVVYYHFSLVIEIWIFMKRGNQEEVSGEYFQGLKKEIKDFLFNVETWTEYERFLFTTMIFLFSADEIMSIVERILKNRASYKSEIRFISEKDTVKVLLNACAELLRKDKIEESEAVMVKLLSNTNLNQSLENIPIFIELQFAQGLVKIRQNDNKGLDEVCNALNTLLLVKGYEAYANVLYATYLMHKDSSELKQNIILSDTSFVVVED